ncbi:MAG: tripartite tricarboxylate transporter substrate binding protein [Caldimonas sp.]
MRFIPAAAFRTLAFAAALFVPALMPVLADAQSYPSRPIHLVVPFSAGGAVDTVGRTLGEKLATELGQTVIIENKPGASANIGADFVAKAAPDGYTLLLGANGLATNMSLFHTLPFNTLKDFAPISLVGNAPLVLVVPADSPIKSLHDLLAKGRADKTALSYGSAGNGSSGHLASALLESVGKFQALHVPYKGGAPALVDLMAGRISFMLLNPLEVAPHLKSGRLRALAVSSTQRLPILPDVPTMAEAGLPGFEAGVWWALVAPAGTPHEVIEKLSAATQKALADPAVRQRLTALGAIVTPSTPEQLAAFLQAEVTKWARVIKAADITVE